MGRRRWFRTLFDAKPGWIGGDDERYRTEFAIPADKTIAKARAYISARGFFDLSINGQRQGGDRVLEPWASLIFLVVAEGALGDWYRGVSSRSKFRDNRCSNSPPMCRFENGSGLGRSVIQDK